MRRQIPDKPYNVLFLCTGNSARSILGEAILNRLGKHKFVAYSAGSDPKGEINPHALALLERLGYPTKELRSKSWNEFSGPDAPKLDFVFTVCDNAANEVCPSWPGQPMTAHWGIPDPATVEANLPVKSLDRLSLQRRLDEIGHVDQRPATT